MCLKLGWNIDVLIELDIMLVGMGAFVGAKRFSSLRGTGSFD